MTAPINASRGLAPIMSAESFPAKAGQLFTQNSLVAIGPDGLAVPVSTSPGLTVVGRFDGQTINTTGYDNGDVVLSVRAGTFDMANGTSGDAITSSALEMPCYTVDGLTALAQDGSGARAAAGVVKRINEDGTIAVEVRGAQNMLIGVIGQLFGKFPVTPSSQASAADGAFGVPFIVTKDIASGTTSTDISVPCRCEVVGVHYFKNAVAGGAGDTVQVKTNAGGAAITEATSLNVAAKALVSPASVDTAQTVFVPGQAIRVVCATATNSGVRVVLTCVARP